MAINKTAQAVFDKAMYLIDAQNESTGSTNNADTTEYRVRAVGILNNLIDVVYPASDTYVVTEAGKRPVLDDIVSLEDELNLDARILRDVLPNGLAAKLLSEENPTLANYFQQCFEENLYAAKNSIPGVFESIETDFGGIEHGCYGRW